MATSQVPQVIPSDEVQSKQPVAEIEHPSQDLGKAQVHSDRIDKELAQYVSDARIHISPERNDELRRMIDKRVLVVMITTYFLQSLDKGTLSFASIMGLTKDTGLETPDGRVKQDYSWLTTCIYIAILVVEYPQNYILARVPMAKYLSFCIIGWGIVLACHSACGNFESLLVVRTLLGIFESTCQPCFVILSSMWYRREEQAARVTYWYVLKLAKCFTTQEKQEIIERVRENQTGIQNRKFKKEQFIEGLTDPQIWGYATIAFCTTLPTSGLSNFANIIIKSFGFTVLQTQLLSMVLGFYIIIILMCSVWLVKKTNQNLLVMGVFCIPSFIGTILLMTLPSQTLAQHIGLLISYYITMSFWSAQTLALSMISRNVAGQTKKTIAIAINFIIWAVGNSIGPQVFLSNDGPRYFIAFSTHLGCYSLLIVAIIALRWHLRRENRKKDDLAAQGVAEAGDDALVRAWEDLTDKENLNFRYVY
ncbi:Fc.00g010490.m01.CDS01 [Cosmosporella sp. VM-42]